jgi:D-alanyl-D-alanine carboxypeptidase (penicillin-binding protein 5/6)
MKKLNLLIFFLVAVIFFTPASAFAYEPEKIDFECKSLIVANYDTEEIIYSHDEDVRVYPASITKIMTAIVVLEKCSDLEKETATAQQYIFEELYGANASTSGIQIGETMNIKDLLACLLIPSGNDAALILADKFGGGSVPAFVEMMNNKAKEIGMTGTHFCNPHGLHNDDHYTTAKDVYIMAKYALQYPVFKELVSTTRYNLKKTNMSDARIIAPTKYMMVKASVSVNFYGCENGGPIVRGVKPGYPESAGRCLVSFASYKGVNLITVCMGGANEKNKYSTRNYAFDDTEKLLDWVFTSFSYKTMLSKDEQLTEVKVTLSSDADSVILYPEKEITAFVPNTVEATSAKVEFEGVPESVEAPVKKDDVMGVAVLYLADKEIGRVNLVVKDNIKRDPFLYTVHIIFKVISSKIFYIPFIILVVLIIIYIVMTARMHKKRKKELDYIGKKNRNRHADTDRYTRD